MSDIWRKKVDPRGRRQLAEGAFTGAVEVLIRTQTPLTPDQQTELEQAGLEIRSIAGNVMSGLIVDVARLEEIASLTFVNRIELSRPMYGEGQQ